MKLTSAKGTMLACYIGYITQAIANNFAPLLFLRFLSDYHLQLAEVTLITTLNFAVQLLVDLFSAKYAERIGYRTFVILAHVFCTLGIGGLAILPNILPSYAGLLLCVILYAIGGGIIEVLISPIVESCPSDNKEAAMALLHSFYCWGHVGVVLLSVLYFKTIGMNHWQGLALLWALVPLANSILFSLAPIYHPEKAPEEKKTPNLFSRGMFRVLFVMMIAAGASEQAMSQWTSAFAESALHVSKTAGDLAGPCAFAFMMGCARSLYAAKSEKVSLDKAMTFSALLCIVCYFLAAFSGHPIPALLGCALCGFSVGIFWPGTFSTAAVKVPYGGTAMYALLALAGDVGCSLGPSVTGFTASFAGGNLKVGLAVSAIFPVIMLAGIAALKKQRN
ncbi:MAG: MFS transporter [Solobacterium sp.]|nr:MFS transporter [Solobacterium sp.]